MKPLFLAMLLAAACKHSTSSSSTSHTETSTVTDTKTSESGATTTTTTVTEQPGETTTTTEEFAPPEGGEAPAEPVATAPGEVRVSGLPSATQGVVRSRPSRGPLVKRTVTVTRSGGETTQSRTEASTQATGASETRAQAQGDTKAQAQTASAPSAGCVGASWIWGLGILAFAVAAILGILKFRKP